MKTIISELPTGTRFRLGMYTVGIGYPWLSHGSIIAIEGKIKPEHHVLELGSGGSTIFWSKRCKTVRSYDMDIKWIEKVKAALPNPSNVTFVYGNSETLINNIRKEPDEYYDWILSDIGKEYGFRLTIMKESISKLKKDGFLIIDNYGERHLMKFDYTGWIVYTFDDFNYRGSGTRICIRDKYNER